MFTKKKKQTGYSMTISPSVMGGRAGATAPAQKEALPGKKHKMFSKNLRKKKGY